MFERGTYQGRPTATVLAEFTCNDGTVVRGRVDLPANGGLPDLLNGNSQFLSVATLDGERSFLAKHAIARVRLLDLPAQPKVGGKAATDDNPASILGVAPGATPEEIQAAYRQMMRNYHPDRFAGVELPKEVSSYLESMARRINIAFSMLEAPRETARAA